MKPTKEEVERARIQCDRLATALEEGRTRSGFPGIEAAAIRTILAATAPPPDVPRPDDMAELARLVAAELRDRGFMACTMADEDPPIYAIGVPTVHNGKAGFLRPHSLLFGQFDNLTPRECADVIQAEERKRAREWAGDE